MVPEEEAGGGRECPLGHPPPPSTIHLLRGLAGKEGEAELVHLREAEEEDLRPPSGCGEATPRHHPCHLHHPHSPILLIILRHTAPLP